MTSLCLWIWPLHHLPPPLRSKFFVFSFSFFITEASLHRWKDFIQPVVDSINYNRPLVRNLRDDLAEFFCRETTVLPTMERYFKYKIGDHVVMDLSNQARRSLSFKYSLNPGKLLHVSLLFSSSPWSPHQLYLNRCILFSHHRQNWPNQGGHRCKQKTSREKRNLLAPLWNHLSGGKLFGDQYYSLRPFFTGGKTRREGGQPKMAIKHPGGTSPSLPPPSPYALGVPPNFKLAAGVHFGSPPSLLVAAEDTF